VHCGDAFIKGRIEVAVNEPGSSGLPQGAVNAAKNEDETIGSLPNDTAIQLNENTNFLRNTRPLQLPAGFLDTH
jgi:hypothetical protein